MNLLSHFNHLILTNDQRNALEKLHAFLLSDEQVFILQGYAGSGKTTLLKGFVEYLQTINRRYQLMAPTGRAAKVINQKTGLPANTIHKGIYSFADLQEVDAEEEGEEGSFFYQYKLWNNPMVYNSVLIVDEASMVSDNYSEGEFFRFGSGYLLKDLIEYSRIKDANTDVKIIFIGDPAQLPPIGMSFSPALDVEYLREKYKLKVSQVEMKEVKRQDDDNGILHAATRIRRCLTAGYFNNFDLRENGIDIFNPTYQNYLEHYKKVNGNKVIICYKNKTALELNKSIRLNKYGRDLPLQPADTVIIGNNNYQAGIMNGEFGVVADVSSTAETREIRFRKKGGRVESVKLTWRYITLILQDEENQTKSVSGYFLENYLYGDNDLLPDERIALYIDFKNRYPKLEKGTDDFKNALSTDPYARCILLKFGYAVTCHKAQGGEWSNAFLFWDRGVKADFNFFDETQDRVGKTNGDFYRWAYTAVTRASEKLFCINPPFFTSFTEMVYVGPEVQNAFKELTANTDDMVEIDVDELLPVLERFYLSDAPITIQDHFIKIWYYFQKHYIDITGWEKLDFQIRYHFKRGDEKAAFFFWINGKNEFKKTFNMVPKLTNSKELSETITNLLSKPMPLIVNRNSNETAILSKVSLDLELEEKMPFLGVLYSHLNKNMENNEVITNIEHLEWKERYTFEKGGEKCVCDFQYNKSGFFGNVTPLQKRYTGEIMMGRIRDIVNRLKAENYVIQGD
ncbi:MAG: AAA family ATPase [Porphyromonadaceae bacterium]|nr:AAA family ATPase [Porphyromonadaceae bacterium]